jgi:hypothetical protein
MLDDTPQPPPETPTPEPRRRGRPPMARPDATAGLTAHTTKTYDLGADGLRTVLHLRRLLAQRSIPDKATVALGDRSLTLEWDETG